MPHWAGLAIFGAVFGIAATLFYEVTGLFARRYKRRRRAASHQGPDPGSS
jgi:hypothetical protein